MRERPVMTGRSTDKEEPFAQVVARRWEQALRHIEAAVSAAPNPEAKVRAFAQSRQQQAEQLVRELPCPDEAKLDMLSSLTSHLACLRAREVALLEAIFMEGNATGAFTLGNPHGVALAMVGALQNLVYAPLLFARMSRVERSRAPTAQWPPESEKPH
ncbi:MULTISPECIES: hypothetical protein [Myxococcus]|uniref:hypothetical protein n=1 Tax=Myxococcus TaxID=32 RepID=UPI0013D7EF56|nr:MULTISPECIES: hypothetical protein [Myxococcus]NVJ24693.1 hypothetical protein [Myxococcus sp. AM011]